MVPLNFSALAFLCARRTIPKSPPGNFSPDTFPQLLPAMAAQYPAAGIECMALAAAEVHGAREEMRDDGAPTENGRGQRDVHESGSHTLYFPNCFLAV